MLGKLGLKASEEKPLPKHVAIIVHDMSARACAHQDKSDKTSRAPFDETLANHLPDIIKTAIELGICHLTLLCPKTTNPSSQQDNADAQDLFDRLIGPDRAWLNHLPVDLQYLGDPAKLTPGLQNQLNQSEVQPHDGQKFWLTIADNYDGRRAITNAVREIMGSIKSGRISPDDIGPELIAKHLDAQHLDATAIPDPDLIIMTSGVMRLDNTYLWQSAYSEFVFSDAKWADFSSSHFCAALKEFSSRERRFGGLAAAK